MVVRRLLIIALLFSTSVAFARKCKDGAEKLASPSKISQAQVDEFKSSKTRALLQLTAAAFTGGMAYIIFHRATGNPHFFSEHLSNFAGTLPFMASVNAFFQNKTGRLVLKHPWLVRNTTLISGIALNVICDFQPHRSSIMSIGGYDIADYGMGLLSVATYDVLDRMVHRYYARELGIDSKP